MPLARYALYSQGVEIYIAPTYDSGEDWIGLARCGTSLGKVSVGFCLRKKVI